MPRGPRAVLLGCAAVGVGLAVWRWNLWQSFTPDGIRGVIDAWGPLGPLVLMGLIVGGSFVPAPQLLLVGAAGALFGPVWGFAYAFLAGMLGTTVAFVLVRHAAQDWAQRALRHRFPRLRALDQRLHHNGFALVVLLRIVLFLAPPLSWALGASRVRLVDHVLGTAVGILPMMGLAIVFAHRVAGARSPTAMLGPDILLPGAALVLLVAVGLVLGRQMLAAPSVEAAAPAGRKPHARPAGQDGAVEGDEHRGRRAGARQTEETSQPVHDLRR
jgi:uncharacterized membrane protein YdjX (TVP38/TMEM64 family)